MVAEVTSRRRLALIAVVGTVVFAGCAGVDGAVESKSADEPKSIDEPAADDEPDAEAEIEAADTEVDGCTADELSGGDDEFVFTSAFPVVDGTLGPACLGGDDPVVLDAWGILEVITPPAQLGDLALFGGFEADGDGAADTLAFVNVLDANGDSFQMAVNIVESAADADELALTMAHEFSHVFTATPDQLDRTDEAFEICETHFNGEGCYLPDSLMFQWIQAFWDEDVLATLDPGVDDPDGAEERCALDDGYFGSYAPISPEEDFAEAFSAYVFDLEPYTDGQADRLDWMAAQPGLSEFRDRADDAGLTPLDNRFDLCGS